MREGGYLDSVYKQKLIISSLQKDALNVDFDHVSLDMFVCSLRQRVNINPRNLSGVWIGAYDGNS